MVGVVGMGTPAPMPVAESASRHPLLCGCGCLGVYCSPPPAVMEETMADGSTLGEASTAALNCWRACCCCKRSLTAASTGMLDDGGVAGSALVAPRLAATLLRNAFC